MMQFSTRTIRRVSLLRPIQSSSPVDRFSSITHLPLCHSFASFTGYGQSSSSVLFDEKHRVEKKTTASTTVIEDEEVHHEHHENRPHHPLKSTISHLSSPTATEEIVHADRLPPHEDPLGKSEGEAEPIAEEPSAQQPGKSPSTLPHSENPSLSEEFVHADRSEEDPLRVVQDVLQER